MNLDQFYKSTQQIDLIELNVKESEASAIFKMLDQESNGSLTEHELAKGIKKLFTEQQNSNFRQQRQSDTFQS